MRMSDKYRWAIMSIGIFSRNSKGLKSLYMRKKNKFINEL